MSTKNGVWHDAKLDPPPTNKEKDVSGNYVFSENVLTAVYYENGYADVWIDKYHKSGKWMCADAPDMPGTVKYWMPLPKIPD